MVPASRRQRSDRDVVGQSSTFRYTAAVKFIGDRLLRKEDPRLVQGRGRYVGDIALPGMLHTAIVRSPHAHARIGAIDASRALEAPGVAGVVTFADLGEAARPLPVVPPHAALRGKNFHLLAGDRARFVGEAVAVVVADSRYAAEDARADRHLVGAPALGAGGHGARSRARARRPG